MLAETEREMQSRWERGDTKRKAHIMGPEQVHLAMTPLCSFIILHYIYIANIVKYVQQRYYIIK